MAVANMDFDFDKPPPYNPMPPSYQPVPPSYQPVSIYQPTSYVPNVTPYQMVILSPGVPQQRPNLPFRCLYLLAVILDMLETTLLGILILIAIVTSEVLKGAAGNLFSDKIAFHAGRDGLTVEPESDIGNEVVWVARVVLVLLLLLIIKIQMYGWKGYSQYHLCSIYTFMTFKVLSSILTFFLMVACPVFLINFIIKVSTVIICIFFGRAVSKVSYQSRLV